MIKEEIAVSQTVESAVAQGAIALGRLPEEVQYEVLQEPKKGFLGFGSQMAKVRVYIEVADEAKPQKKEKPQAQAEPKKAEKAQKKAKAEKKVAQNDENSPAILLLQRLIENMNLDAQVCAGEDDAEIEAQTITIEGPDASTLIGHHGDTMDAVQYLANLASNRSYDEEYPKIKLDIEGYRARREETLRRLANRTAQKALKFKRNFALEPMNPYERRIIHSELQKVAGVSTHSVGSGNGRRVIVTFGDAQ
jgi:spoIIIJ-associated protein